MQIEVKGEQNREVEPEYAPAPESPQAWAAFYSHIRSSHLGVHSSLVNIAYRGPVGLIMGSGSENVENIIIRAQIFHTPVPLSPNPNGPRADS